MSLGTRDVAGPLRTKVLPGGGEVTVIANRIYARRPSGHVVEEIDLLQVERDPDPVMGRVGHEDVRIWHTIVETYMVSLCLSNDLGSI